MSNTACLSYKKHFKKKTPLTDFMESQEIVLYHNPPAGGSSAIQKVPVLHYVP